MTSALLTTQHTPRCVKNCSDSKMLYNCQSNFYQIFCNLGYNSENSFFLNNRLYTVQNKPIFFFEKKIYFIQKKTNRPKKYIYTFQNLYTHTINIEHIIYMQESSGQPHIDQYRSKLYSLYTSNDRL